MDRHEDWTLWDPISLLKPESVIRTGLVVLNQPFQCGHWFEDLWKHASVHVAVDGGANCLYETMKKNCKHEEYIPHLLTGDFDSVKPEVLQFYANKGCTILNTPDQDHTDFTKALQALMNYTAKDESKNIDAVIAICGMGGRTDHVFANFQTLCLAESISNIPVFLFSGDALSWLLKPGKHKIKVRRNSSKQSWCGLIPLGEPCQCVTTKGLKWNLNKTRLSFGELVSTSNTYVDSEEVIVETHNRLLWTMAS